MSCCDIAFDADLAANVLGDLVGAPALDAGDVKLGKSAGGHVVMIAAQDRTGYPGLSGIGCGQTVPKASAATGPTPIPASTAHCY